MLEVKGYNWKAMIFSNVLLCCSQVWIRGPYCRRGEIGRLDTSGRNIVVRARLHSRDKSTTSWSARLDGSVLCTTSQCEYPQFYQLSHMNYGCHTLYDETVVNLALTAACYMLIFHYRGF
jgi:hypothetical protein